MTKKNEQSKVSLVEWLGLKPAADLTKARPLGSLIGACLVLLGLTLIALLPVLLFLIFQSAFSGDDAAVRNIGLVAAALVGAPVVVWRAIVAARQSETAAQSLFNEKIDAATEDLYARRQAWSDEHNTIIWHDDITRRNAAIDRLEGLVKERPNEAERVSRLLSVYVRELSADSEFPAQVVPKDTSPTELREWVGTLPKRSDMENAVQTLGRLRGIADVTKESVRIDLRGANLQAIDFESGNFDDALMQNAQMQGAVLLEAQMQRTFLVLANLDGANLFRAQLQGTIIREARLQGARLDGANLTSADLDGANLFGATLCGTRMQKSFLANAQLQEAILWNTDLKGADLIGAKLHRAQLYNTLFDADTHLLNVSFRGAFARSMDQVTILQIQPFWQEIFADGSVKVSDDQRPSHWVEEILNVDDFQDRWHAWRRSIGPIYGNPE